MTEINFEDIKKKYNMTDEQLYAWAKKSLGLSKEDVDFQIALQSNEISGDIISVPADKK